MPADVPSAPLTRRQVLVGGAALLASASVLGAPVLRGRPNALARLAAAEGLPISLGFVEGARTLAEAVGAAVAPARDLPAGDATLVGRTVQVRVHGTTPGLDAGTLPDVEDVALDALFAPAGGADPVPFHAWSLQRGPSPRAASPTAFTSAVEHQPLLGFALTIGRRDVDAAGAARRRADTASAVLASGRDARMAKLRPGLYLLGIGAGPWDRARLVPAMEDRAWSDLASVVVSVTREP